MAYQRYIGREYTAGGNVTPIANVAVSLGQPQKRWKELYVDANSLHLGNVSLSVGKTGEVEFMKTNKLGQPVTSIDVANVHASIDAGGVLTFYSANTTGNVSLGRGLAVGYVGEKVPGANLDVNGNAYISGATTIGGALAVSVTPSFNYGANVTGNVSVTRSIAVGYADGRVPQANLEVKGNTYITGATTIAGALTLGTDLAVAQGGTGASSLADGYVLLGSGAGAITALNVTAKGSVLAGDGSTDPVALAVGDDDQVLTADSGEASGLKWAASGATVANRSITQAKLAENSVGGSKVRANVLTGGQIIGSVVGFQSNVTGNVSVTRSLAVGYVDGRVPQANLEVKGNAHITGATTIAGAATLSSTVDITGKLTSSSVTPAFYGANVAGNVSVSRSLAVGWTDGIVPAANLSVKGNAHISSNVVASSLDVTNYFKVGDGAVAQPSIANLGDGNTGVWFPAADTIAISTGGAEAVRISGIGQNTTISSHVVNHKGLATANYTEYANNITNAGSSFTVSTGTNMARYTLNAATCEITLPAGQPIQPGTAKTIILYLKQDATGGRTVNFNAPGGEALEWNNSASEPEVVSGANKVSIYTFMKFHGDTNWYCSQSFIEN